ncbi:MAG: site-specific DNA-methyltransferase, partial [Nitrososphaerota archaeon]|nr:site-specific DNA-methyltransferase [Nitrososphaerota archaeon]
GSRKAQGVLALTVTNKGAIVTLPQGTKLDDNTYDILPRLTEMQREALEQKLLSAEGQREPLVLWNTRIVLGFDTYRILVKNGKEVKVVYYGFKDETECRLWLMKHARSIGNPNEAQRIESVLKLKKDLEKIARLRKQHKLIPIEYLELLSDLVGAKFNSKSKVNVQEILAGMAQVSKGTFANYQKIEKYCNKTKGPSLLESCLSGKRAIYAVSSEVRKAEEKEREREKEEERRKSLPKNLLEATYNDTFQNVLGRMEEASVNCILADVPYWLGDFSEKELKELATLSEKVLKEDGVLILLYAVPYLDIIFKVFPKHLTYLRLLCDPKTETEKISETEESQEHGEKTTKYRLINHNATFYHKQNCGWKPIVIFCKNKEKAIERNPNIVNTEDVIWQTKAPTKPLHKWQQSIELIEYLVKNYSLTNDLVLDPVAGSGTTIRACLNNYRRVIAIEKDEKTYKDMLNSFALAENQNTNTPQTGEQVPGSPA